MPGPRPLLNPLQQQGLSCKAQVILLKDQLALEALPLSLYLPCLLPKWSDNGAVAGFWLDSGFFEGNTVTSPSIVSGSVPSA